MTDRKEQILAELHSGITTVSFTKVDGERRDMRCTLNEEFLPARQTDNVKQARKENPAVCSVWDVDKEAWRSFRWENVIDEYVDKDNRSIQPAK